MTTINFLDKWTSKGINTHHCRKYFLNGETVRIDKTLNGAGGFYSVYKVNQYGFSVTIPVKGMNYWGDGWNWKKAVKFVAENVDQTLLRGSKP